MIFKNRQDYAIFMLNKYKHEVPGDICSDIGSGFGWMRKHIQAAGKRWQPLDYVRKIDEAIIWDLNDPCPSNALNADICIMLEVLEHLPNPLLSIQNISDHLKSGAILILSVPNPSWSKNRVYLFFKGMLYSFQKKHLEEHHVFTPWKHIVEYFFEQNGFEVMEYHAIQRIVSKPLNLKSYILYFLERFLEKRDPMAIGISY